MSLELAAERAAGWWTKHLTLRRREEPLRPAFTRALVRRMLGSGSRTFRINFTYYDTIFALAFQDAGLVIGPGRFPLPWKTRTTLYDDGRVEIVSGSADAVTWWLP